MGFYRYVISMLCVCGILLLSGQVNAAATVSTFAGLAQTTGSADGTAGAARFFNPYGAVVDSSGNIYVADYANHLIRKITPAAVVSTLALTAGGFVAVQNPAGLALDGAGNIFVVGFLNHSVYKLTLDGGGTYTQTLFAGGDNTTFGNTDGNGAAALFSQPEGIGIDSVGNLYVADGGNHTIRKITPAADVSTLAGSTAGYLDATGTAAKFNGPIGIAVDSNDNVYVGDRLNYKIRKIDSAGVVTTLAGSTQGFNDATGTAAQFNTVFMMSVDENDNIYVADYGGERLRRVTLAGVVTTLAGSGAQGNADGVGIAASFRGPSAIAIGANGPMYVADYRNHTIRKLVVPIEGTVTIASNQTYTNSLDVTLQLTCRDNVACTQMEFSNDNVNWGGLIANAATANWTIAAGDGVKTVYARFKNAAADLSVVASDTIILDTTAPATPVITAPVTTTTESTARPVISGTADANISVSIKDGASQLGLVTADGAGAWTLAAGGATLTKGVHSFTATATDAAGNVSVSASVLYTVGLLNKLGGCALNPYASNDVDPLLTLMLLFSLLWLWRRQQVSFA